MLRLILFAIVVLVPLVSTAADLEFGDRVFLKPDAQATKDGIRVDIKSIQIPATIVEVHDETVSLGKERVRKSDVMTADEALEFFNEAIKVDPQNARAYFTRGVVLETRAATGISILSSLSQIMNMMGEFEKAINDLNEAIRLDPTSAEAYGTRARVLLQTGKTDAAIEDSTESIRLSSLNTPAYLSSAYLLRAMLWETKGEYEKAVKDSAEAINADPKSASAFCNIARLKSTCPDDRVRDGQQAVEFATKACELTEDSKEVDRWFYLDTLAAAYAETGDFKNAIKWQEKALNKLQENDCPAWISAMVIWQCDGHLKLYRANMPCRMPQLTESDVDQDATKTLEARWVEDFKKLDEAIRLEPTNAMAYFNRGEAWAVRAGAVHYAHEAQWTNRPEEIAASENALKDLNEAIRLDPANASAFGTRGRVFATTGKYDEAINDLTEAIKLDPYDTSVYASRGDCWNDTGEFDKAVKDWTEGIQLDPENKKVFLTKLAWLRATCPDERYRNGKEAIDYATKAYKSVGLMEFLFASATNSFLPNGEYELYGTLAAAYAEAGDFTKAIEWQEKAIENAGVCWDDKTEERLVPPGYNERLALFRDHKPFRDVPNK